MRIQEWSSGRTPATIANINNVNIIIGRPIIGVRSLVEDESQTEDESQAEAEGQTKDESQAEAEGQTEDESQVEN